MSDSHSFNPEVPANYYENASYSWSQDSIRYMNTVSAHTRANYLYMQECGYFQTSPPYFTERSALPSYLILYTISGAGTLFFNGKQYPLDPGSCFYLDCMTPHRYECSGSSWEFLWLHFYGLSSEGYYTEFAQDSIPVLHLKDTFQIESSLRRILAIHQKKAVYAEALTANLIHGILTEFLLQKMADADGYFPVSKEVNHAVSYIQAHYAEALSLDTIAAQVNLSKYHLSREFTRHMGVSISQYIINCRIGRAKELLRETSLPVGEIAFLTGIPHVSHFIRLFQEREGMTPLKYRKLW